MSCKIKSFDLPKDKLQPHNSGQALDTHKPKPLVTHCSVARQPDESWAAVHLNFVKSARVSNIQVGTFLVRSHAQHYELHLSVLHMLLCECRMLSREWEWLGRRYAG